MLELSPNEETLLRSIRTNGMGVDEAMSAYQHARMVDLLGLRQNTEEESGVLYNGDATERNAAYDNSGAEFISLWPSLEKKGLLELQDGAVLQPTAAAIKLLDLQE